MALPHARKIEVDGKTYEWLVKNKRGSGQFEEDAWVNAEYVLDRRLTVRNPETGKVVQKEFASSIVTPKDASDLIRESLKAGRL